MVMEQSTMTSRKDAIFEREFLPQIDALYNFAYYLVGNETDANDLVQETFFKAYKFADNYEENSNAKAWLFRILKNAFINEYRKRKKRPNQVDYEEVVMYHNEEGASPFTSHMDLRDEVFGDMMGDEVSLAVNTLPVDFRVVILLCDIEDFSYEEISEIVNVPIGTVRSRLFRARNMLKEKLQSYASEKYGIEDKRKK